MEEVTQVEAGEESRDFSWSGQRARWKILSEGQWEPCMRVLGKEWPDEICGFKKLLQLYCGKGKDVGHQGKWGQELRLGPGGACTDRVGFKSLWLNVIILVKEDDTQAPELGGWGDHFQKCESFGVGEVERRKSGYWFGASWGFQAMRQHSFLPHFLPTSNEVFIGVFLRILEDTNISSVKLHVMVNLGPLGSFQITETMYIKFVSDKRLQ